MRNLSPEFKEHLSGSATTLCWLWKLTRGDGFILGFTDHDRPLTLEGVTYESRSSLIPSETDHRLGFAADNSCLLYTSPSPRDRQKSRMPSSA